MEAGDVYELHDNLAEKLDHSFDWPNSAIHSWSLYNDTTEIYGHLEEFARLQQWEQTDQERLASRADDLAAVPGGAVGAVEDWFWTRLEWFKNRWMFIACLWSTFLFLRDFLVPLLIANCCAPIRNGYRALLGQGRNRATSGRKQRDTGIQEEATGSNIYSSEELPLTTTSPPPISRVRSILKRRETKKEVALDLKRQMVSFRRKTKHMTAKGAEAEHPLNDEPGTGTDAAGSVAGSATAAQSTAENDDRGEGDE